jgi:hypothetical protein
MTAAQRGRAAQEAHLAEQQRLMALRDWDGVIALGNPYNVVAPVTAADAALAAERADRRALLATMRDMCTSEYKHIVHHLADLEKSDAHSSPMSTTSAPVAKAKPPSLAIITKKSQRRCAQQLR